MVEGSDQAEIPNHTTILPNLTATVIFFVPCLIFYIINLNWLGLVYSFIILFLLTSSVSNLKWKNEINKNLD